MNRDDIHLFGTHSNINSNDCQQLLESEVYETPNTWRKFIKIILISFGVGFLLSGIIFFFAYNWDNIGKIQKIIITQSLVPIGILIYLFYPGSKIIRDLGAISATIMVGVSYAVYGQVYQTGANDFDFFLNWSLSVFIWVLLVNTNVLWLIYLILLNTIMITYSQQYMYDWTTVDLYGILFMLNSSVLILFVFLTKKTSIIQAPNWFTIPIGLAAIFYSTIGISMGIHSNDHHFFVIFLLVATLIYALGIYIGYSTKRLFYLGSIYFSLLFIFCFSVIEFNKVPDEALLLFISFIVIASITIIVKHFLKLQTTWKNGKGN